jgi:hypothetical protein
MSTEATHILTAINNSGGRDQLGHKSVGKGKGKVVPVLCN